MKKPSAFLPIACIVIGGLWFLRSMGLIPTTISIFSFAFIVIGMAIFLLEGVTKSSIVTAPMFVYIGIAIYLTQNYLYNFRPSAATGLGIFIFGLLLLLARSDLIPEKRQKQINHSGNTPPN